MPAKPLTPEKRRFYDRNGYLLVEGLFAADELEVLSRRFEAIANEAVRPAGGMLVMRDVMVAKGAVTPETKLEAIAKIQDFHNDPVLFEGYVKHPRLLDWVEGFTGPDVKSVHTMLINKPPGVDGRHPLHQDLLYFPFRPASRIVAVWTAIERCTRENGCLVVVPGTHAGDFLPHGNVDWEWVNFAYFAAEEVGAHPGRVHLEMEPGDTVFFHPLLLHGSGRNRTSGFRRAISAHYASAECKFIPGGEPIAGARPYLLLRGAAHEGAI